MSKKPINDLDEFGLLEPHGAPVGDVGDGIFRDVPRILDREMKFDTGTPESFVTFQVKNISSDTATWSMTLFGHVEERPMTFGTCDPLTGKISE